MHGKKGISSIEFSVIICLVGLFFVIGVFLYKVTTKSAYDIMAKHDLSLFSEYQKFNYQMNGTCFGEQGQSIRNDGIPSDLIIADYKLSEGVSITIISGDPEHPSDSENPYTFQARHFKSDTVFEVDFRTGIILERN